MRRTARMATAVGLTLALAASSHRLPAADETPLEEQPIVFRDDFENGAEHWKTTDAAGWRVEAISADDGSENHVYHQFQQSQYKPPHRSPVNIALVRDVTVGDFQLTARVRSTARDYPHRSVCLFFGYQDPTHFYYVHLGQRADDHANQVFIVDDAPRTKISLTSTDGTPWDSAWHDVKIIRRVESGTIEVYFDDMEHPVMTAKNDRFRWGQVGVGSFDDTGQWDDLTLRGKLLAQPE